MPGREPPVQFRDTAIEAALRERAQPHVKPGITAARDLARYYRLLALELRRVWLTEPEASLICDALNGVISDATTMPLIWATVDDAIRLSGLAAKWHVEDPGELVLRLRDLSPAQCFALGDAVERFWLHTDLGTAEALRAVGLARD